MVQVIVIITCELKNHYLIKNSENPNEFQVKKFKKNLQKGNHNEHYLDNSCRAVIISDTNCDIS